MPTDLSGEGTADGGGFSNGAGLQSTTRIDKGQAGCCGANQQVRLDGTAWQCIHELALQGKAYTQDPWQTHLSGGRPTLGRGLAGGSKLQAAACQAGQPAPSEACQEAYDP